MTLLERFLDYVKIDSQSDPDCFIGSSIKGTRCSACG